MNRNSPILLVLIGSFNPPHLMHLRVLESAREALLKLNLNVVGGCMSPVHDHYKKHKPSLIGYAHRRKMVEHATHHSWITCSTWEGSQGTWTPTRPLLEALQEQARLEHKLPNLITKLVCGADLLESFNVPGLWERSDIEKILSNHGLLVIRRPGSNPDDFIFKHDLCSQYSQNISIVYQPWTNDISSTTMRTLASRGSSLRYLTPDSVCQYISENKLYSPAQTTN